MRHDLRMQRYVSTLIDPLKDTLRRGNGIDIGIDIGRHWNRYWTQQRQQRYIIDVRLL
jgi:hypothetical protein